MTEVRLLARLFVVVCMVWPVGELQCFGQTSRPRIVSQPRKQIVPAGQIAEFEVTVADETGVTYAWYHHNHIMGPQEGGDQRILRLGPVAKNHDWVGQYSVVVRNQFGARRSVPARLVVVNPPEITVQPQPKAMVAGQTTRLAVRTVFDGFPKTYQWYFNNQPIEGARYRVLWLRRVQPEQAGFYKVVIQNLAGPTTSEIAVVRVD